MTANISGAAINPAVGIGQTVFQHLHWETMKPDGDPTFLGLTCMWIYFVGPMLGGLAAGLITMLVKSMAD